MRIKMESEIQGSFQVPFPDNNCCIPFIFGVSCVEDYGWFSPDFTASMLVHRTKENKFFWEFDSIIIQNMSHNLLLLCAHGRLIT